MSLPACRPAAPATITRSRPLRRRQHPGGSVPGRLIDTQHPLTTQCGSWWWWVGKGGVGRAGCWLGRGRVGEQVARTPVLGTRDPKLLPPDEGCARTRPRSSTPCAPRPRSQRPELPHARPQPAHLVAGRPSQPLAGAADALSAAWAATSLPHGSVLQRGGRGEGQHARALQGAAREARDRRLRACAGTNTRLAGWKRRGARRSSGSSAKEARGGGGAWRGGGGGAAPATAPAPPPPRRLHDTQGRWDNSGRGEGLAGYDGVQRLQQAAYTTTANVGLLGAGRGGGARDEGVAPAPGGAPHYAFLHDAAFHLDRIDEDAPAATQRE